MTCLFFLSDIVHFPSVTVYSYLPVYCISETVWSITGREPWQATLDSGKAKHWCCSNWVNTHSGEQDKLCDCDLEVLVSAVPLTVRDTDSRAPYLCSWTEVSTFWVFLSYQHRNHMHIPTDYCGQQGNSYAKVPMAL